MSGTHARGERREKRASVFPVSSTALFGPVPLPLLDNQATLPNRYPRMEMMAPLHCPRLGSHEHPVTRETPRLTYNGRYTTKLAHSACSLYASTSNTSSIACRTAMRSGMTKTPGIGCPATTRA